MALAEGVPHPSAAPGRKPPRAGPARPAPATLFVWGAWALLLALLLVCVARYGHDVPLAEDWLMVAALTGHEPDVAEWLWAQNNEHRLPAQKLVYLVLLEVSGGDFRAGMVANVLIAAAVTAALITAARRIRGGVTSYTDAFFPVVLLHLGHWENFVWGWQLQFVASAALTLVLLAVVVRDRPPLSARSAYVAAGALALLPLCGANGLVFALAMAPWAVYVGVRQARATSEPRARRIARRALAAAGVAAVVLVGVYFIGWSRPSWVPPNPGVRDSLKTAVKFASMGFGPVASHWWTLAAVGAVAVLAPAAVLLVQALWRALARAPEGGEASSAAERERTFGIFCFAGGSAVLTLAMGWGRAALFPEAGLPDRYALLAVPAFCAAYFVWQLYGRPPVVRRAAQAGLLVTGVALLRGNVAEGLSWRDWYVAGAAAVERDVAAGVPRLELARKHRQFLMHWDERALAERIAMLRRAGMGPFADVRER